MEEKVNKRPHNPPGWLVIWCKHLWKWRGYFWGAIVLASVITISGNLLFVKGSLVHNHNLDGTLIGWLIENPAMVLVILVSLLALTLCFYLGSYIEVGHSSLEIEKEPVEKDPERLYLLRIIDETETFEFKGIPTHLSHKKEHLDTIFVPLQFWPYDHDQVPKNRSLIPAFDVDWQLGLGKSDRVDIEKLWSQLTEDHPVAIIQGFHGMGKSTQMARLALKLARFSLKRSDPQLLPDLRGHPIPIFLHLEDYQAECVKAPHLSLMDYIALLLKQMGLPSDMKFLKDCLEEGRCVVLLDGFDAVLDDSSREAIKLFIEKYITKTRDNATFNRFLITSRVTYEPYIFSHYPHYLIAELTPEQMSTFWEQWNAAAIKDSVEMKEVIQKTRSLIDEFKSSQEIRTLAEKPLLLTLLAVMQQNNIELPRQKTKLYQRVIRTLLENRNHIKIRPELSRFHAVIRVGRVLLAPFENLSAISETRATGRLGLLAFEMQDKKQRLVSRGEVLHSLMQTARWKSVTKKKRRWAAAQKFLMRLCEQGDLFVSYTGSNFGFLHHSFQEYFASYYMLKPIQQNFVGDDKALIEKARRRDDTWREPFLLAVARKSNKNPRAARKILDALLKTSQETQSPERDLFLAADCVIEAKPATIGFDLEEQITQRLLQVYENTLQGLLQAYDNDTSNHLIKICEQIENTVRRWLICLSSEDTGDRLLKVLRENISGVHHPVVQQRTGLTLLLMIAKQLGPCSSSVFQVLIPPLLSLANQRVVGKYKPSNGIPKAVDLTVADLALTVLSFMGKNGPAGLLLKEVSLHFEKNPKHLEALARYSLKSNVLLTPVVVPQTEDSFQKYKYSAWRWIKLCQEFALKSEKDKEIEIYVDECYYIHKQLLEHAEEARYPAAWLLLDFLTVSESLDDWQKSWKNYLRRQLESDVPVSYQETILLWTILFPEERSTQELAEILLNQYTNEGAPAQPYARHFLAAFSNRLRMQQDWRYIHDMLDMLDLSDLRGPQDIVFREHVESIPCLQDLRRLRSFQYIQRLQYSRNAQVEPKFLDLREMRSLILIPSVTEKTREFLSSSRFASATNSAEYVELLTILLGRVLFIRNDRNAVGPAIESELMGIVQTLCDCFEKVASNNEVRDIVIDIIKGLPVQSIAQIKRMLQIAKDIPIVRIQQALIETFKQVKPQESEVRLELESAIKAIEDLLKQEE